jgi:hypothetical protein
MKNKERTNSQCLLALPPELTAATYVRFLSLLRKGTVSFSASTNLKKKNEVWSNAVFNTYNSSTQEAEAGRSQVPGDPASKKQKQTKKLVPHN